MICCFQPDLEDMQELSDMRSELMDHVIAIMNKASEYRLQYDSYMYLWVDDRVEFMRQFLLYNHVLTQEEIEANADEGMLENPPTLQQFRDQVIRKLTRPLCTTIAICCTAGYITK